MMYLKLKRVKNILHAVSFTRSKFLMRHHLFKILVPEGMFNQPKRSSVFQLARMPRAQGIKLND